MATVDQDVVVRWRLLPFARFGQCSSCRAGVYLRGRRRDQMVCVLCFSEWPLGRQMPR